MSDEMTVSGPAKVDLNLRRLEQAAIDYALESTGGNRAEAARLLGINIRTLRRRLNERKLQVGDRVLVRELDVFGKVTVLSPLTVVCEPPMPGYVWTGKLAGVFK